MSADIINLLSQAQQLAKELAADRDACLERAKRSEAKCADQKAEFERQIAKLRNERDILLNLTDRRP